MDAEVSKLMGQLKAKHENVLAINYIKDKKDELRALSAQIVALNKELEARFKEAYPNPQTFIDEQFAPVRTVVAEYNLGARESPSATDVFEPDNSPTNAFYKKTFYERLAGVCQWAKDELLTVQEIAANTSLRYRPVEEIEQTPVTTIINCIDHALAHGPASPISNETKTSRRSLFSRIADRWKKHVPIEGMWTGIIEDLQEDNDTNTCTLRVSQPNGQFFEIVHPLYDHDGSKLGHVGKGDYIAVRNTVASTGQHPQAGAIELLLDKNMIDKDYVDVVRISEVGRRVVRHDEYFWDYIVMSPNGAQQTRSADRKEAMSGKIVVGTVLLDGARLPSHIQTILTDGIFNRFTENLPKLAASVY